MPPLNLKGDLEASPFLVFSFSHQAIRCPRLRAPALRRLRATGLRRTIPLVFDLVVRLMQGQPSIPELRSPAASIHQNQDVQVSVVLCSLVFSFSFVLLQNSTD